MSEPIGAYDGEVRAAIKWWADEISANAQKCDMEILLHKAARIVEILKAEITPEEVPMKIVKR